MTALERSWPRGRRATTASPPENSNGCAKLWGQPIVAAGHLPTDERHGNHSRGEKLLHESSQSEVIAQLEGTLGLAIDL